jgi:hypothetical protein
VAEKKRYFIRYDNEEGVYMICENIPAIGSAVLHDVPLEMVSDLTDYMQSVEDRLHALEARGT